MLLYNDVSFPFSFTTEHSSKPEPDPSGVDVLLTETTIASKGVLHPGDYPAVPGETPAETAERITHLLTTPRRMLRYFQDGLEIIRVDNGDDANGPMPKVFSLEPCLTKGSYVVHFAVTIWRRLCTAADARGYLSLKWTDHESQDEKGNIVRRRSGLMVVSRQFTGNADERRQLVVPRLPPGCRRHADYTLSEDGLRLRFTFVDRLLHKGVPFPAVKVSGSMAETTPKNGIGMRRGELNVRVEGRPGTSARDLLNCAIRIGMSRVYATPFQPVAGTNRPMIGGGVRESLGDDETVVELTLSWAIPPTAARLDGQQPPSELRAGGVGAGIAAGAAAGTVFGPVGTIGGGLLGGVLGGFVGGKLANDKTPENRSQAAVLGDFAWLGADFPGADLAAGVPSTLRGTGLANAIRPFAAALCDPCGQISELRSSPGDNGWIGTGTSGTVTARVGPVGDDKAGVAVDPLPGVWDHWKMSYTFKYDSGYVVVPSTKTGEAGEMVRLGNPQAWLDLDWELMRTGGAPTLPAPVFPKPGGYTGDGTEDTNWLGRTGTRHFENVGVAADGVSFVYTAAGSTSFEALDWSKVNECYPCPPWLAPATKPKPTTAAPLVAPEAGQLPAPVVNNYSLPGVPPPNP